MQLSVMAVVVNGSFLQYFVFHIFIDLILNLQIKKKKFYVSFSYINYIYYLLLCIIIYILYIIYIIILY